MDLRRSRGGRHRRRQRHRRGPRPPLPRRRRPRCRRRRPRRAPRPSPPSSSDQRASVIAVEADVSTEAGNVALIAPTHRSLRPDRPVLRQRRRRRRHRPRDAPSEETVAAGLRRQRQRPPLGGQAPPARLAGRGEGYFCSTASAAGLLAQIGSAPYTVTKHAAVAFAEWLSITYGDRGIRVSCLCPQGVNTDMLERPRRLDGRRQRRARRRRRARTRRGRRRSCSQAIADERFLILPHPEVLDYLQRKVGDPTAGWPACAACRRGLLAERMDVRLTAVARRRSSCPALGLRAGERVRFRQGARWHEGRSRAGWRPTAACACTTARGRRASLPADRASRCGARAPRGASVWRSVPAVMRRHRNNSACGERDGAPPSGCAGRSRS